MRNQFSEYYRPTKKEFEEMWDSCDFIFDSNILLNLYRYTIETRKNLIEILEQIIDRIWIPYQVGFEYHTKRISEIENQINAYDEIKKIITGIQNKLENELLKLCNSGRHPYINCEDFLSKVTTAINDFLVDLDEKKEKHPDFLDNDPIRDKLNELFAGKVCDQLDPKEKEKVVNQGEDRYKKQIPPGYKDDGFGDLIIWFEIINHAKKRKNNIIFVTDDGKEDWWYQYSGKTIGPRPELIKEILENAGVKFYMYSADRFMSYAEEYLQSRVEQKAIEEAREIRLHEAEQKDFRKNLNQLAEYLNEIKENARFAIPSTDFSYLSELVRQTYPSTAFSNIDEIARRALASTDFINTLEMTRLALPSTDSDNIANIAKKAISSIEEISKGKNIQEKEKNNVENDDKSSDEINSNDETSNEEKEE